MKEIPLSKGQVALIDDGDYEQLSQFKWHAHLTRSTGNYVAARHSHAVRRRDGSWRNVSVEMHNQLLDCPRGFEIDHRNLNTLDNRRENLRIATRSQNARNRRKRRGTRWPCKSVFQNGCGRFTVRVVIDGKRRSVGTFGTIAQASAAYDRAATKHYGEFARLNTTKQEARVI